MGAPRRWAAALASVLWVAVMVGAFWCGGALYLRISDRLLPDFVQVVLWAGIALAGVNAGTRAFPFWRSSLGVVDRRRLVGAGMVGAILGCALGTVPAFLVLPPQLTAPVHSPRAMVVLFACGFFVSVAAAYREARTMALFAPASPEVDSPLVSDGVA